MKLSLFILFIFIVGCQAAQVNQEIPQVSEEPQEIAQTPIAETAQSIIREEPKETFEDEAEEITKVDTVQFLLKTAETTTIVFPEKTYEMRLEKVYSDATVDIIINDKKYLKKSKEEIISLGEKTKLLVSDVQYESYITQTGDLVKFYFTANDAGVISYLYEGQTKQFEMNDEVYSVKLKAVSDATEQAIFEVNGITTNALAEKESHHYNPQHFDEKIRVLQIYIQEGMLEKRETIAAFELRHQK
ncbi:hypothetical protein J4457_00150 [Candidatus Woesearchaeota archaeon]|nr:hypothetical protein [Candidatus Woesearchaeota archaeon]